MYAKELLSYVSKTQVGNSKLASDRTGKPAGFFASSRLDSRIQLTLSKAELDVQEVSSHYKQLLERVSKMNQDATITMILLFERLCSGNKVTGILKREVEELFQRLRNIQDKMSRLLTTEANISPLEKNRNMHDSFHALEKWYSQFLKRVALYAFSSQASTSPSEKSDLIHSNPQLGRIAEVRKAVADSINESQTHPLSRPLLLQDIILINESDLKILPYI